MRRSRKRRPSVSDPAQPDPGGRKPRLMVAGEFSAGKTQLINGLIGERVLPSNVTATALPPVWLVYGSSARLAVDLDGRAREIQSLDEVDVADTRFCVLSHPAPFLERFDIIDTPGNSDPNIPSESWERMLDYADALVWCTNATQAWRQSEKSVWTEMAEHLVAHGTLLVTHADRMADERTASRVMRRVKREAGSFFETILMASLLRPDDLDRVRAHLDALAPELAPLPGNACPIVRDFARSEAERTPVIADSSPVRPRRIRAQADRPAEDSVQEGKEMAVAEAPDQGPSAETAAQTGSLLLGIDTDPAVEPVAPDTALQDLALDTEEDGDEQGEFLSLGFEQNYSAQVHVLVPAAEADQSPAPQGSVRALWNEMSRDLDRRDATAVLDCVDALVDALDRATRSSKADAAENDLAQNFPRRGTP